MRELARDGQLAVPTVTTASGSRWTRCATATSSRSSGSGRGALAGLGMSAGGDPRADAAPRVDPASGAAGACCSPATPDSRARWLALWLQSLGAQVTGFSPTSDRRRRCTSWRGSGRACRASRRRARPRGGRRRGRGVRAGDRVSPRRAVARAALVRRATGDLRDERDGHGQRARRRAQNGAACASSSSSPPTSATRTASGSGAIARTSRWAGTIHIPAPRAARNWSRGAYRRSFFSDPRLGARRLRPRRKRDRRRRLGRRTGCVPDIMRARARGRAGAGSQPGLDPAVAARAQPAERLPGAGPGAVGLARARRRLELRTARGRRAPGRAGSSSRSPSVGPGSSRWDTTRVPIPTRLAT